ncbi:MAG: hypothetical protein POELPBGB_02541 [Bacteroidia bacterium]|nr:hypothetical protein [Bacteroidia bacterium]
MKKLTPEELDKMELKPPGRVGYVRSAIVNMKPGEILLIEPKDWKWKDKWPDTLCKRIEQKHKDMKLKVSIAMDKSGWVVVREK